MQRLVDDLLTLARLDAHRSHRSRACRSTSTISCCRRPNGSGPEAGSPSTSHGVSAGQVLGDPDQLRRGAAQRARQRRAARAHRTSSVSVQETDDAIEVVIADDGRGIPAEHREPDLRTLRPHRRRADARRREHRPGARDHARDRRGARRRDHRRGVRTGRRGRALRALLPDGREASDLEQRAARVQPPFRSIGHAACCDRARGTASRLPRCRIGVRASSDGCTRCMGVSVITTVISLVTIVIATAGFGIGAALANVIATTIATIPSYHLNRRWTWGRTDRSNPLARGPAVLGAVVRRTRALDADRQHRRLVGVPRAPRTASCTPVRSSSATSEASGCCGSSSSSCSTACSSRTVNAPGCSPREHNSVIAAIGIDPNRNALPASPTPSTSSSSASSCSRCSRWGSSTSASGAGRLARWNRNRPLADPRSKGVQ